MQCGDFFTRGSLRDAAKDKIFGPYTYVAVLLTPGREVVYERILVLMFAAGLRQSVGHFLTVVFLCASLTVG